MKFYEMIFDFDESSFDEGTFNDQLPEDIITRLKNYKFKIVDINKEMLDYIWEIVTDLCQKYIETKWINDLGIDRNVLLEDIKYHSVLIILLSKMSKNIPGISIKECASKYAESEGKVKNEKNICINEFCKKWNIWNDEVKVNTRFNKISKLQSIGVHSKDTNKKYIHMDWKLFYKIIDKWKMCPYDEKYYFGMTLNELHTFYLVLEKLIKESENLKVDKIIRVFIIERFFNIDFLVGLYGYINISYYSSIKGISLKNVFKTPDDNKKPNTDLVKLNNIQLNEGQRTLLLSNIVSIPMIFSRRKYINSINKEYEKKYDMNGEVDVKKSKKIRLEFIDNLFYLNNFLVPLLIRTYYDVLIMYLKYLCKGKENRLEKFDRLLKRYLEINYEKYCVDPIPDNIWSTLSNNLEIALQANITKIIYDYDYESEIIKCNECIFEKMKKKEDYTKEYKMPSYAFDETKEYHFLKFPFTGLYSMFENARYIK